MGHFAQRHPHHRALQRAGFRDTAEDTGSQGGHGRQISRPGGAYRDLLVGDVQSCRCTARNGISLQSESVECRNVAREMSLNLGRVPEGL